MPALGTASLRSSHCGVCTSCVLQVTPTTRTLNTLMSVCARAGDRKRMLEYFQRISDSGVRPPVQSWNIVLDYCAKHAVGPGKVLQADPNAAMPESDAKTVHKAAKSVTKGVPGPKPYLNADEEVVFLE